MPLPDYYHKMPYQGDNHFGKEVFSKRFFLLKQQAVYPIIAIVGIGVTIGVLSSAKHLFANPNVALSHKKQGGWATEVNPQFDVASKHRPVASTVLAPSEDSPN